ncbi:MAG: hypothetical protein RLY16_795, partial [Bacteroidota bacterium]
ANNATFGDPCVGTGKRLYVEALSSIHNLVIRAIPTVTGSTGATRCGTGTLLLAATASSGATIDWYAASSGGTALSTSNSNYTTPSISSTTTYYAEARNITTGCVSAARTAVTATVTVPTISNFTPTVGTSGTTVVITGTNFTGASAVRFGGTNASSFVINSATQITAVVGSGTTGAVTVTTSCGTATGSTFTYYPAPTITSFTPTTASFGDVVTITGTNFTGTTSVNFGATAATSFVVVSATSITAVVGYGSTGNVSVTTPGGTATRTGFTYNDITSWTGSNNSNWNNSANWSHGIPGTGTHVSIPPVETYPAISGNYTIGQLTMEEGTSIRINANYSLTLTGNLQSAGTVTGDGELKLGGNSVQQISGNWSVDNLTLNNASGATISSGSSHLTTIIKNYTPTQGTLITNDNLVLHSDASGTARVAIGSSAGNYISGKVRFERFVPARRAWRLFNYPFTTNNAPTIFASIQEGAGGTTSNPNPGYGTHITGGSIANGFDQSPTNNSSIKVLNNGAWINLPTTNTPTSDYSGYFLFVRGSRANNLNQGLSAAADNTTLRGTGNLRQGDQNITVSGSGWQLISNPFASPIDLSAVANSNTALVRNNFKFWDPRLGGTNYVGGYVTASWNGTSYDYAPAPVSSLTEFAQSGAMFFVDAKNAGTLTIQETHKSNGGVDYVFRPGPEQPKFYINLRSRNNNNTTPIVDGVMVGYDENFSNAVDDYDAAKLSIGGVESLSILHNSGKLLSIERRQDLTNMDTIQLNLANMANRGYQFEFKASNFDSSLLSIWLEDTHTHQLTPVRSNGTSSFDFSIAAGYNANRYRLLFKQNSGIVLPVTLQQFNATKQGTTVITKWITRQELNMKGYWVERSADGIHFNAISSLIEAKNIATTANYQFEDVQPMKGLNYYRLRMADIDNRVSYSSIVKINFESVKKITVYPNPVTDQTIHLKMLDQPIGRYQLTLTTADGKQIMLQPINYTGNAMIEVPLQQSVATGHYILNIQHELGSAQQLNIQIVE